MRNVIEVKQLKRTYVAKKGMMGKYKVEALKGIDLEVKEGEIFGLLGPNGAGKTTTIKILTTLLAPSEGEAKVLDRHTFGEEKYIRKHINFVFGGERGLYWRLTGYENLQYFGDLYKVPEKQLKERIDYLLKLVGLKGREHEKVESYSKGMKQRLQIAKGLINDPTILFLDEPTIGLDPVGAKELRELVKQLKKEGKTILLTTHYMYEAEELCDHIAIINGGEIIARGTVAALKLEHLKEKEGSLEDVYIHLVGGKQGA